MNVTRILVLGSVDSNIPRTVKLPVVEQDADQKENEAEVDVEKKEDETDVKPKSQKLKQKQIERRIYQLCFQDN